MRKKSEENPRFFYLLEELKEKVIQDPLVIALGLSATIFVVAGIFLLLPQKNETSIRVLEESPSESGEAVLDIAGAVLKPGVYKLPAGSRLSDAVAQAGGFAPNADAEYISKSINLAQKVSDGAKIYIPKKGEAVQSFSSQNSGALSSSIGGKININTASQSQLESLPGIGPVTAGKIIAARPYQGVDELLVKKIVGQKTFEKIKGDISVF